ncbi:leucine-rich repeat-containing protein 27 [Harpia harpyja]|uniref:leucine-rich repeat-containing protein 27 n=1 Tax=Harpia harpyja TaxID=202280 RepID=UPI0022B0AF09|nr:leucine-rich repeat-containing protein 27 [Harpia harpyja]
MDDSCSKEFNGSGDDFGAKHLKKRNLSSSNSSKEIRKAVEQCLSSSSSTLDVSRKNIKHLTKEINRLPSIKYFHLEGNVISTIPEDLFQKLPHLVWLDLRYNKIKALPPGIGYHRQLKTLLLEGNPIKQLPAELGDLTSLTALNLRHCPLEFPPKDIIQKGLKSILCFLQDSGNGKLLCMEPAALEMPPVEKLNLSELLQSSLDLSDEWPNEEEKLRLQKLKEEIIKDEKEELLADEHVGATHDFTEAGKSHRKQEHLYSESATLCRTIQAKQPEKCRLAAEKELKEEQALFEQRKNNKEMLQEWHSRAKLMKEKKETFRFSPTSAAMIPKHASYATDNISYYTMKEGAEKQDHTPEIIEERLQKAKDEATRSLRDKKLEQHIKQHTQMMKARGEKLKGTSQVEMKKAKQDFETVEDLQTKLAKTKGGLPLQEYCLTAFLGEFPPDSPRMQTQKIFSSSKF